MATIFHRSIEGNKPNPTQTPKQQQETNMKADYDTSTKSGPKEAIQIDKFPDGPYVLSSAFYLSIFIFIGLPMWFYTCSVTRYPLADLSKFEKLLYLNDKHNEFNPKLHIDISIVQLTKNDNLTEYLRLNLPTQISTSIENINYNIGWRVRRPIQSEDELFKLHQNQYKQFSSNSLEELEIKLINIHKPTNRFRLFIYLIEDAHHKTYCDPSKVGATSFTISFERFVYLCSPLKANYQSTISNIREILEEIYVDTVSMKNSKNILGAKLDLLFSILSESTELSSHEYSLELADKIHKIYDKNVKSKFPELNELVNIRLLTNNVIDFLNSKQIAPIFSITNNKNQNQKLPTSVTSDKSSNINLNNETRTIKVEKISFLLNSFQSRVSKPSSQFIQNILTILPSLNNEPMAFKKDSLKTILESDDMNYIILANHNDDKGLILSIRSLIRRIIGLKSVNLCKSCLVRRDVFINRWEIDAIMSVLIITKLHKTFESLNSIQQQVIGIKIPKEVAQLAVESNTNAIKSLEYLNTKQILESYRLASRAYELSEAAFFDSSLIESLYFPEDMKYGVYMPLFLPMTIALLWSLYNIVNYIWRRSRKA